MAENPDIHFRAVRGLAAWLEARREAAGRRSVHAQAQAELETWQMVQQGELSRIRLTVSQARCLGDVLNGAILAARVSTPGFSIAYMECADAFRLARDVSPSMTDVSSYGAKWAPDGTDPAVWEQALLDLLAGLSPAGDVALRYAIASWWTFAQEPDADTPAGFARVGLNVRED